MNINILKIFCLTFVKNRVLKDFSFPNYDLIYFINGTGTIEINGCTKKYRPNDVLFVRPNEKRTQIAEEDSSYICIRFELNDEYANYLSSNVYTPLNEDVYDEFKRILKEHKLKNHKYFELCNLKTEGILILLSRYTDTVLSSNKILNVVKEIDDTLFFNKSICEIAEELNYSYDYFRHKFKDTTGQSPMAYIINKKIEHACELLMQENYTCTEISNLLGFSSSSQFSKLFKRETGISPKFYKKHSF